MTREEMDFIGSMNMFDEISNEAYKKIMTHCEEQEPCEDCISRQVALVGLASIAKAKAKSDAQKSLMGRVMFFTEQLPSVTPQLKMGRWWERNTYPQECRCWDCSECQETVFERTNYCPNCGAKMEVSE